MQFVAGCTLCLDAVCGWMQSVAGCSMWLDAVCGCMQIVAVAGAISSSPLPSSDGFRASDFLVRTQSAEVA